MMMTHIQKPSLSECGEDAKSLVSEFSFLKDDKGDGEVYSCYKFLCICVLYSHGLNSVAVLEVVTLLSSECSQEIRQVRCSHSKTF